MPSYRANGTCVYRFLLWGSQKEGKQNVFNVLNKEGGMKQTGIREFNEDDAIGRTFPFEIEKCPNAEFQVILIDSMKETDPLPSPMKGIDAILFLWDSRLDQWVEDIKSMKDLLKTLGDRIVDIEGKAPKNSIPMVILVDNRNAKDCHPLAKIREVMKTGKVSQFQLYEVNAASGLYVRDAFLQATIEIAIKKQAPTTPQDPDANILPGTFDSLTEPNYYFKIIILGAGGIGKAAFLLHYKKKSWVIDHNMTIGANFKTVQTSMQLTDNRSVSIIAHVVDAGGEERFQKFVAELAKDCDGAFILVDQTDYDTFRELPTWLKLIRSKTARGLDVPVWLVVNKMDLPNHEVEEHKISAYMKEAKIRGYTFTSVKENTGVKEAWESLFLELLKETAKSSPARNRFKDLNTPEEQNAFIQTLTKLHEIGAVLAKVLIQSEEGGYLKYENREAFYSLAQIGPDAFPATEFLNLTKQIEEILDWDKRSTLAYSIILAQISVRLRTNPNLAASNLIQCTKLLLKGGFGKAAAVTFVYAACMLLRYDPEMLIRKLDEDPFYEDLVAANSKIMAFPLYLLDILEATNEELDPLAGLREEAEHIEDGFGISLRKVILETIDWVETQLANPKITQLDVFPPSPAAGEEISILVSLVNQSSRDVTIDLELRLPTCSFPETRAREIIHAHSQKIVTLHPGISESRHRSITARISVYNELGVRTGDRAHEIIIRAEDKPISILNTEIQPKNLRKGTEAQLVGKLENKGKTPVKIVVKTVVPGFDLPQKSLKIDLPLGVSEFRANLGKARSLGENQLRLEVQDDKGGILTEVVEYFNVARSWKNIVGNVLKEVFLKIPI